MASSRNPEIIYSVIQQILFSYNPIELAEVGQLPYFVAPCAANGAVRILRVSFAVLKILISIIMVYWAVYYETLRERVNVFAIQKRGYCSRWSYIHVDSILSLAFGTPYRIEACSLDSIRSRYYKFSVIYLARSAIAAFIH